MTPKAEGCICQVCADRGEECLRTAESGEDECSPCQRGRHTQQTAYPRGRWFGDADDYVDPFR